MTRTSPIVTSCQDVSMPAMPLKPVDPCEAQRTWSRERSADKRAELSITR